MNSPDRHPRRKHWQAEPKPTTVREARWDFSLAHSGAWRLTILWEPPYLGLTWWQYVYCDERDVRR